MLGIYTRNWTHGEMRHMTARVRGSMWMLGGLLLPRGSGEKMAIIEIN